MIEDIDFGYMKRVDHFYYTLYNNTLNDCEKTRFNGLSMNEQNQEVKQYFNKGEK